VADAAAPGEWVNWSGAVRCTPRVIAAPQSEAEVAALVTQAGRDGLVVRVAGSGHSFTPLVATSGMVLDLAGLSGIVALDPAARQAEIRAGTKISAMGEALCAGGLALANQGDVDVQAICGALGTGTHGTGRTLGSLSTQIAKLRLVTAGGDIVEISKESDGELFEAARVSLGMLGVTVSATLNLVPAYRLHERTWLTDVATCFAEIDEHIAKNRHFEFFWRPQYGLCDMKTLNPTEAAPDPLPHREGERIDHSDRIFPSQRLRRFNEMEFAIPAEAGPDCFREIWTLMRERYPEVNTWPIEYRTQAADEIFLSPAYGRATITISIHQGAERPYEAFFRDAEAIFRNHRGRPHWGKIHYFTAKDLAAAYPCWERFLKVRERMDPKGRFLNGYLRGLFLG
jgi:FAD/FMN-containing dehydrogenase